MKDVIETAIHDLVEEMGLEARDFAVEHPNDLSHGDYATNVAMMLAKTAGENPRHLAEQIATKLEGQILNQSKNFLYLTPGLSLFQLNNATYHHGNSLFGYNHDNRLSVLHGLGNLSERALSIFYLFHHSIPNDDKYRLRV